MLICIASVIYVVIENHIIGAILFAFGLLSVLGLRLNLLTGKAVDYRKYTPSKMLLFLLGNTIGCAIISFISLLSSKSAQINEFAYDLCSSKFSKSILALFASGVLCGILMALAVRINRIDNNNVAKTFVVVSCVAGFILIGGEHCIADIGYMMLGKFITSDAIIKIVFIVIGNVVGSIMIGELYGYG